MNYRPNRRRFWPLGLFGLIWLAGFFGYNYLSRWALIWVHPVWQAVAATGNASLSSDQLGLSQLDHDALVAENASLRASLGHYPTPNKVIAARILSDPWRSPYDILLVDTGSQNAGDRPIMVGDQALVASTVALGQVVELAATTAKIKLFSAGGNELPAFIGPLFLPVLAHGRGGGNFRADLPREAVVAVGDQVLVKTSDRDLILGLVGAIDKVPGASLQSVYFRYPFNLNELTLVEIQTR